MSKKKDRLLLFFDTEFTDFTDMDLISHPNQHHALFDAKMLKNDFKIKYAGKEVPY